MKLSKTQAEVVELMKQGWALCSSATFDGGSWIQKNGCGKGGETKTVSANTVCALYKKGVIELKIDGFPTRCHKLTKEWS